MEYLNKLSVVSCQLSVKEYREAIKTLLLLLAPFAPFMTEELWDRMGEEFSIHTQKWPQYDPKLLKEEKTIIVIEINGKVRGQLTMNNEQSTIRNEVEKLAKKDFKVKKHLKGKKIKRVVFVPGKLINFVTD